MAAVGVSRRLREALEERNERVRVESDWALKRLGELAQVDVYMLFDGDCELRLQKRLLPFDVLKQRHGESHK